MNFLKSLYKYKQKFETIIDIIIHQISTDRSCRIFGLNFEAICFMDRHNLRTLKLNSIFSVGIQTV